MHNYTTARMYYNPGEKQVEDYNNVLCIIRLVAVCGEANTGHPWRMLGRYAHACLPHIACRKNSPGACISRNKRIFIAPIFHFN